MTIHPLTDEIDARRNANTVAIRMAALASASRIHQRVHSPSGGMFSTTADCDVLASAVAFERYIRTGEIQSP